MRIRRINLAEALYTRYQRVAFSIAHKFSVKFNRPYHEMVDEALWALGISVTRWPDYYDPKKKTKPVTWIYHSVYWHLLGVCTTEQAKRKREQGGPIGDREAPRPVGIERLLGEVGSEGRVLLHALLEAPQTLAEELTPRSPKRARAAIDSHLGQMMSTVDIQRAWDQVEFCLYGG